MSADEPTPDDPTRDDGGSGAAYPPPGSYVAELFETSEEAFEERFERAYANFEPEHLPAGGDVTAEDMNRLEGFVRLHREILGGEQLATRDASFRPVPSGRTFGMLRWFDPEWTAVLGAHVPPLHGLPASLAIGFPLPPDADPIERLTAMGFPPPDDSPTFVFGELEDREGKTLIYVPGPSGLAELVYRVRRSADGWDVLVTAERPPEPRFTELVSAYRESFGDRETRHPSLRSALGGEGTPSVETARASGVSGEDADLPDTGGHDREP